MPNVNFWVKDPLYIQYVNLSESQKKKLKKSWRKMILKAVNLSDGDEKHDFVA